jgi:Na+-driven multidrug efflux pump
MYFGVDGVWYSFAIGDVLATIITYIVVRREIKKNLQ